MLYSKKIFLRITSPTTQDHATNLTMLKGHLQTIQIIKNIGGKTYQDNMENEPPKYQIYLSTSPEVQRSSQAILIDTPDDKYQCIYTGEGTLTDSLFIPAIIHNRLQTGNVYLLTHPDDYDAGMYSGLAAKEDPPQ